MTGEQYREFLEIREGFRKKIELYRKKYPEIQEAIKKLYGTLDDGIKGFVYNEKMDDLTSQDEIKYIWVADNPGLNESLQNRYAVGISGKTGKNFMESHGLVEDFDREVIVLNKSFIHTKITSDLKKLVKYTEILNETQDYMADIACTLQKVFRCQMWVLGISNFDKIFKKFKEGLLEKGAMEEVYFYYHFSQGQFKKAYNRKAAETPLESPKEICRAIGIGNRERIIGGQR